MKDQNFTTSMLVNQTQEAVCKAINNVRGWWSENIKGSTDKFNSEFIYQDKYLKAKMKITELTEGKVVWDVIETHNEFFKDNKEWNGTQIIFEIKNKGDHMTEVKFTHVGLVPQFECFNVCSNSWEYFITTSLKSLIETGKGKEISTDENSYTTSFVVDQSPQEVFDAINHVREWWSAEVEGNTEQLHSIFFYHYKDVHLSKMEIVESIPGKRVVWFVKDNYFNFVQDQTEWRGSKIIFKITKENDKTKLTFTHHGLLPRNECYDICEQAWTGYIQGSLKNLIESGAGQPNLKEEALNSELVEQWGLPNK